VRAAPRSRASILLVRFGSLKIVAVSDRTRKILWTRAGGRCSICRAQLVSAGTSTDDPCVIGEEAHIVAQSLAGPRAGHIADPDCYDNLILLCSRHHKQVDDQVGYYTVDRLKSIKVGHEAWVQSEPAMPCGPVASTGPAAAFNGITSEALIQAALIFAFALIIFAMILHHGLLRMGST
jgi:hypothetical protein